MYRLISLIWLGLGFELSSNLWDTKYNKDMYLSDTCYERSASVIYFDVYKLNHPHKIQWADTINLIANAYQIYNNINCNNVQFRLQYEYDNTNFSHLGDPCDPLNTNYKMNGINRFCFDPNITVPAFSSLIVSNTVIVTSFVMKISPLFARTKIMLYNLLAHEFGHVQLLNHSIAPDYGKYTSPYSILGLAVKDVRTLNSNIPIDNYVLASHKLLLTKDDIQGILARTNRDRFIKYIIPFIENLPNFYSILSNLVISFDQQITSNQFLETIDTNYLLNFKYTQQDIQNNRLFLINGELENYTITRYSNTTNFIYPLDQLPLPSLPKISPNNLPPTLKSPFLRRPKSQTPSLSVNG